MPSRLAQLARARVVLVAMLGAATADAAFAQQGPYPTASQGVSFIFGAVPTAAGTVETESGGTFGSGYWSVPLLLKWTPAQTPRSEISLGMDAISAVDLGGGEAVDVGNRVTLTVRHLLGEAGGLRFGIAPRAVVFLRETPGVRLGGIVVVEGGTGPHTLGVNLGVTVATAATELNPRMAYTAAFDYSFSLPRGVSLFAGLQYETVSHGPHLVGLEQGVTWSIEPNIAVEAGVQELGLNSGERAVQFLTTLVVNWGRIQ